MPQTRLGLTITPMAYWCEANTYQDALDGEHPRSIVSVANVVLDPIDWTLKATSCDSGRTFYSPYFIAVAATSTCKRDSDHMRECIHTMYT